MSADVAPIRALASVPLELIHVGENVRGPRLTDVAELADSIRALGVLQPITVQRRHGGGGFMVVFGHRRLAAAKMAGRDAIPALIVGDYLPDERLARQVAENTGRAPLDPIEEARAFKRLRDLGKTVEDVAKLAGVSGATVRSRLSLLDLSRADQARLREKDMTLAEAGKVAQLVKTRKPGVVRHGKAPGTFNGAHRLAKYAEGLCDEHDDRHHYGPACGPCWEAAIRADERGEVQGGADAIDEVQVDRAAHGEVALDALTHAERAEAVRRLTRQGLSDGHIAGLLSTTDRTILRIRQRHDIATTYARNTPADREKESA